MSIQRFDILETPIRPGQTIVEASAGTGKTFALTGLVVRLVLEGTELSKLLLVTFTIAATEELKTRLREALRTTLGTFADPSSIPENDTLQRGLLAAFGDSEGRRAAAVTRLEEALQSVDEASVFTIHGFCKRVLEQAAFESGAPFAAEFSEDAPELFERAVADFWHRHTYDDPLLATLFLETSEEELRGHYTNATRFPNTAVVPPAEDLEVLAEALDRAMATLREEWDGAEARRVLLAVKWRTKTAFNAEGSLMRGLTQVERALAGDLGGNLGVFKHLAPEAVSRDGYARGKDGERTDAAASHAVCVGCGTVAAVVARIEQAIIQRFVHEVGERYGTLREEARLFTFDDLLTRVHAALAPDSPLRDQLLPSIQNRWSHALIDEFQDTDPIQYDIFRWAFDGQPLVFVGDPKQSIYSFRGADLFAYLDAKRSAAAEYALDTNWRSSTPLVEAVNAVFSRPASPFLFREIAYQRVQAAGVADAALIHGDDLPPLVWWSLASPDGRMINKGTACDTAIAGVVAEIQRLLADDVRIGDRAVAPRDIAVLVRSNRNADQVAQGLQAAGIPSVVSKTDEIWESAEVADLEYVLRGILRPQDRRASRTALATELWGWNAAEIAALDHEEERAAEVSTRLREWQKAWREHGILHTLRRFMEEEQVPTRLLRREDGERRMTNLRHAVELLHQAEVERQRGPEELLRWLRSREHQRIMAKEESELRLESDAEAVQISTIHKSKGLQYEIVFAPLLWSVREPYKEAFPLVHTPDEVVYDLGSDAIEHHRRLAQAEALAEELRLAYVAMTRAKQRCYVSFGPVRYAEASAPGYLLLGHEAAHGASHEERALAAITHAGKRLVPDAQSALKQFVEAHEEVMALVPVPRSGPRVALQFDGTPGTLRPRQFPADKRRRLIPWTITSFSGLTAGAYDDLDHTRPDEAPASEDLPRLAFAAGRQAGLCLHEILEEVDFAACKNLSLGDGEKRRAVMQLIDRMLRKYGLEKPEHHRTRLADPAAVVAGLLADLVDVPLPLAGGTLSTIPETRQIREWRFVLPVDKPSPGKLADAFRRHGENGLGSRYPALLERLDGDALARYLTGFADLVFEHEGRWFVYDWKSNLLGEAVQDYAPERLAATALSHHYELQVHLYTLGLHRYLKSRLRNYDYDRHMGGGALVFLRGVEAGSPRGFHARRPSRALIDALDHAFCPS